MKKLFSLLALLGGLALPALAQTEESTWYSAVMAMDSNQLALLIILGVVLVIILLLLILMVYLMSFMAAVFKRKTRLWLMSLLGGIALKSDLLPVSWMQWEVKKKKPK